MFKKQSIHRNSFMLHKFEQTTDYDLQRYGEYLIQKRSNL